MTAELKSCPFCGDNHARIENGGFGEQVSCNPKSGCGAVTDYYDTEAEAIAAWNRRAPDPIRAALEELVACKKLKESIEPMMHKTIIGTKIHTPETEAIGAEYRRRQPLAWQAAFAALAESPKP